jgi:hypothetical protein
LSFKEDKEAVVAMKEMSQSYFQKNVPTIPNKYRGLTDSKKEEDVPDQ